MKQEWILLTGHQRHEDPVARREARMNDHASIFQSLQVSVNGVFATHNGVFHADDVCGVAALVMALTHPDVPSTWWTIARTRNAQVIDRSAYAIDVGGVSDGASRFDHHQRGGAGVRENGVPFASFGLVWRALGEQCILRERERMPASGELTSEQVQMIHARFDEWVVQPVDAGDCGYKLEGGRSSLSEAVSSLNPTWLDEQDFDSAFIKAVQLIGPILQARLRGIIADVLAHATVAAAVEAAEGGILLLESGGLPWQTAACAREDLLYVIFRSPSGEWMVQCVPPEPGSFEKRKPLPEAWAGLRGSDLAGITGVEDSVFCHIGRFICGAGSPSGAFQLAELAMAD